MLKFVRAHKWAILGSFLAILIVALVGARLYLNIWLPRYVNGVLNNIEGYQGSIEDIDIALYRGAYRVHKLKLFKRNGHIPTPFIDIETLDLSLQWGALFHGRIVSDVDLYKPQLNFAISKSGAAKQDGKNVDWSKPIKDLMPIDINVVTFREGKLSYRDFSSSPEVNIYIHHMQGEIRNLRNVVDENNPLPADVRVGGDSIGKGKLSINGKMNILKPVPDMKLNTKLEKVYLPALNTYTKAYAAVDVERGKLDIYSELNIKNNRVSGYVKPIATDIALLDLRTTENPIQLLWESLVAIVIEIFSNQSKDQFATVVPLEGNLDNIETNTWSAIGGIIRNAFVEALERGFGRGDDEKEAMKYKPKGI